MKTKLINPSYFNLFIPIAIAIHIVFPTKTLIGSPLNLMGIVIILAGITLNLVASSRLRQSETPVDFDKVPVRLVTDGPFGFSRNPIYLSGVTVLLGLAIFLGSLISFGFPVLLFLLLDRIYIPIEEREMEGKFGIDYIEYKQAVRRWV